MSSAFQQAVDFVKELPKDGDVQLSNDQKLKFYGLYKQATVGTCSVNGGSRPGAFSFQARAKWDAWNALGDMTKEQAEQDYVKQLTEITANSATHKFAPQ